MRKQLFLDCDGVLADFDGAFAQLNGYAPRDFHARLPLLPDAKFLYEAVKHLRPIILTGSPKQGWADDMKRRWAAVHFPGVPLIPCMSARKNEFCFPGDVLVDDRDTYLSEWVSSGGVYIRHVSAAASIPQILAVFGDLRYNV